MFVTIGIRYPQNIASNHFGLRARLLRQPTQCNGGYLKGRWAFPLALGIVPNIVEDKMFQALKEMEKPTPPLTRTPRP